MRLFCIAALAILCIAEIDDTQATTINLRSFPCEGKHGILHILEFEDFPGVNNVWKDKDHVCYSIFGSQTSLKSLLQPIVLDGSGYAVSNIYEYPVMNCAKAKEEVIAALDLDGRWSKVSLDGDDEPLSCYAVPNTSEDGVMFLDKIQDTLINISPF